MHGVNSNDFARYGIAVVGVIVALLLRWVFEPLLGERLPLATLYVAVGFVAWYGGRGPAVLTVILGSGAVAFLFMEPSLSFSIAATRDIYRLLFYAIFSAGCVVIVEQIQTARRTPSPEHYQQLQRESALRQKAEATAAEEGERFRVTLASIGDGVITTDAEGRVSFVNDVARQLTGWTQQDAAGLALKDVFNIVNETTRLPVDNPVEKVLREGVIVGLANHTVLIARDGTERPIDDSAAPIRDGSGRMIGVVLIFRDVAEQRRAQNELKESEVLNRTIMEAALDCIITMDQHGKVVEFNPAAERAFGYSRAEAIGQELASLIIPPSLRERHARGLARHLVTGEAGVLGKRIEVSAMRADGSEFMVELAITRLPSAGAPLFTAYLRDISERIKAQQHRAARLAVTQVLNRASGVAEGALGVLQAVCESLAWEVGSFWIVDDATDHLVCFQNWHRSELPANKFAETSKRLTLAPGEGLPGRVWATGKPVWIRDIREDENFPRRPAAVDYGLHSGFAYPILVDGKIVGVFEFFSRLIREVDAALLEMMDTVAGNFAQFNERQIAERQLRQSEQKLQQLADAMPQIVWTAGPDGEIDYQNRQWYELTGLPESLGNKGWQHVMHRDDAPIARERWSVSQQNGTSFEMEIRLLDRRTQAYRWYLIRTVAVKDDEGGVIRWFGTGTDIHDRKRAEESSRFLAEASAALAGVVDYESTLQKVANLAVPYFGDWSTVEIATDNDTLRRLAIAHRDAEKLAIVRQILHEYPADPESPTGSSGVLRSGRPQIISDITDEMLMHAAQDERHLSLIQSLGLKSYMCVPLIVSGKAIGVFTFATASSGRRYSDADLVLAMDLASRASVAIENTQLYQALRESDRRKDEFLATLAHELRNPLAPIHNSLQILKMPQVDAETVARSRDMMERQVHHLVRLVDDLLDVSRVMGGKIELRMERVELASIVARAIEMVQPLVDVQGHELTVRLPSHSLAIDADPVRLSQVVGNILTNAAKYSNPNGEILLTAHLEDDRVVLRVRDKGIGIDPGMLSCVFQLFTQVDHTSTKAQGGLGIGLTLAKNLVEMHNGTIEAHSEGLGKGSEFVVRLPISQGIVPGKGVAPAEGTSQELPPAHRLLVVDDNQDAALSLEMLLKLHGHEVQVAHSGLAALEITSNYVPDAVFLDIGMPGMDGYEVARRLRQQPGMENVVLAAVTGWGQEEDRKRTSAAGFNHHLVKPPELAILQNVLAGLGKQKLLSK